jgi:acyl carrier protein
MTEPEFDKQCNGVVSASSLSRAEVEARIISMVRELALEVGHRLGNISPQSAFGRDLGIESIDVINLIIQLESIYNCPLGFEEIQSHEEGDLLLEDLVSFVCSIVSQRRTLGKEGARTMP